MRVSTAVICLFGGALALLCCAVEAKASSSSLSRATRRLLKSHPGSKANSFSVSSLEPAEIDAPVVAAAAAAKPLAGPLGLSADTLNTLKISLYIGLWYLFNIWYNIFNKKALNNLPLPWTMATLQLGIGLLYVFPVWLLGVRKAPKLSLNDFKLLAPIASMHTIGHLCTVISLGAGSVSFTHIVKAAEPFFSTVMSAIFLKSVFPLPVYATLIPIVGGVALASMKELSFTWVSFLNAMGSNTAFSLRAIFSKKLMTKPIGENMNAANLYSVLTVISFCFLAPFALAVESSKVRAVWTKAIDAGFTPQTLLTQVFLSGISYYLYNEVAFLALDNLHPITHAVSNTIKRVVIIVASVIVFKTTMTTQSIIGSSIAITGVLMYSLAKQYYQEKK